MREFDLLNSAMKEDTRPLFMLQTERIKDLTKRYEMKE